MTVFSMLTTFSAVAALLALPASGGKITFDMLSNGKHWWGGEWAHQPNGGSTNDCICIKGTKMNGEQDAVCFDGMRISRGHGFIAGVYYPSKTIPFDGNYPIDISTDGRDGLWFDRVRVETNKGKRWHGSDNTVGWCLSRDRRESFDKYATMDYGICFTTLSIQPDGQMLGDHSGELGYYRSSSLAAKTRAMCKKLGRRRAEMSSQEQAEMSSPAESDSSDSVDLELELLDADPTGESPNQVHSERDALVVKKLHKAIRGMVQSRFPGSLMTSDLTDGHIDKILNSAMFEVEQIVEQKEHDGEVKELRASDGSQPESAEPEESTAEPEESTAELEESAGSAEPESDYRNVQGRLIDLEESP